MKAAAVVFTVSVCVFHFSGFGLATVDSSSIIPSKPDAAFKAFQQALAEKQDELKKTVLFNDFDAFKSAFDSFKSKGSKESLALTPQAETNSDFAKFQKFIVKYMRQYNNIEEFNKRYQLFLDVLKKMGGYNDGGDGLAGINFLSDRTDKEKEGLYGKQG